MVLTREEAIELVAIHLSTIDPLDGKSLDIQVKKRKPATEVIVDGHLTDRMVFYPRRNGSETTWSVTVWKTFAAWKRNRGGRVYVASWPGTIQKLSARKSRRLNPKPKRENARQFYMEFERWHVDQMRAVGKRWFGKISAPATARYLLKGLVMAEVVRRKAKNPALFARPRKVRRELRWDIVDVEDICYGSGLHELHAWEDAAKKIGIEIPVDARRPWRAPTKVR